MPEDVYELIAYGARYWFALLGVVIVLRAFWWLRRDGRRHRRMVASLPDAGYVGELSVLSGSAELPVGQVIPLPTEGTLGSVRSCDVYVPCEGIGRRHAVFSFHEGKGLYVEPARGKIVLIDGRKLVGRAHGYMGHGSRIAVGAAVLRMRLFEGLEAAAVCPRAAQLDAPEGASEGAGNDAVAALPPNSPEGAEGGFCAPQDGFGVLPQGFDAQDGFAPQGGDGFIAQDGFGVLPQGFDAQDGFAPQGGDGFIVQDGFDVLPQDAFAPQDGGGFVPQDDGGFAPQDGGGFVPQDDGGFAPQDGGGFAPQDDFLPQDDGGFAPLDNFPPQDERGFPPQDDGGFPPPPAPAPTYFTARRYAAPYAPQAAPYAPQPAPQPPLPLGDNDTDGDDPAASGARRRF